MQIKLPNLGEGADSGTVASVLVKVGDKIEKDQTIMEVENEKAVVPVPSSAAGTISKISVKEGDKVSTGSVLLVLDGDQGSDEGDEKDDEESEKESEEKSESESKGKDKDKTKRSKRAKEKEDDGEAGESEETSFDFDPDAPMPAASPTVRRACNQLGLDLRQVPARGPGGRVEMDDLRSFIQHLIKRASKKSKAGEKEASPPVDFAQWGSIRKEPMSELRKAISRRMVESATTLPRVTQFDTVDITDLEALRKKHSDEWKQKGAPLTQTVFAIAAVVRTLEKHPLFRSSLDETVDEIIVKDYYHIGIAADTKAGLMVPVIRDADRKSLFELAQELVEKANQARERKLKMEDMKGGVFTISNQGGIGGAHFTPIINKPESAILGIGRSALQPAVVNGKIEPRLLMPIAISYDHRLIDGAEAARFTVDLAAAFGRFNEKDLATP